MNEAKGDVTVPTIKVDQTPKHKQEHRRRRASQQEWERTRTMGFIQVHNRIEINDRVIAETSAMPFYEVKSFGQTLDWSLNKVEIMLFYERLMKPHIEYRLDHMGEERRYTVVPDHLAVWEIHPYGLYKRRIC